MSSRQSISKVCPMLLKNIYFGFGRVFFCLGSKNFKRRKLKKSLENYWFVENCQTLSSEACFGIQKKKLLYNTLLNHLGRPSNATHFFLNYFNFRCHSFVRGSPKTKWTNSRWRCGSSARERWTALRALLTMVTASTLPGSTLATRVKQWSPTSRPRTLANTLPLDP